VELLKREIYLGFRVQEKVYPSDDISTWGFPYNLHCLSQAYRLDRGVGRTKQNTPSSKELNHEIQTP
jgi:hypothetical protein